MTTDPIADLLTTLRNGVKARHEKAFTPCSKVKIAILEILKKRGFIQDFKKMQNGPKAEIEITLSPMFKELHLKRMSKPGQRMYIKNKEVQRVLSGFGIAIVSTPKGVMSGDEARKKGVGGEYICEVW